MKRLILAVIVTTLLAASSLFACGGGSCLDEYPCNVPADDGDGSFDGATHVAIDGAADGNMADAIDDISTIDDGIIDAEPARDASDD